MLLKDQFERFVKLSLLAFQLVYEAILDGKLKDLFHRQMFRHRLLTQVEIDLATLTPPKNILPSDFHFVELIPDEIIKGKLSFAVKSRGFKLKHSIKRGLRIFALIKDFVVVGDLWCVMQYGAGVAINNPDLDMLGIHCKDREAYIYDVFIDPSYRGKNLAVPLQISLQSKLKSEGYRKLYSYYYNDNLPAMRMHRTLKYKEIKKFRASRFFFYKKIEEVI